MKYLMTLILSTVLISASALAAQGSASIPHFLTDNASTGLWTFYYLSNITGNNLEVEIDLYNRDGTLMQDDNSATTGLITMAPLALVNSYSENGGNTAKFTIGPHQTVSLQLAPTPTNWGHGFIRWKQDGTRRKAMLAHGRIYRGQVSSEVSWTVPINDGKAF